MGSSQSSHAADSRASSSSPPPPHKGLSVVSVNGGSVASRSGTNGSGQKRVRGRKSTEEEEKEKELNEEVEVMKLVMEKEKEKEDKEEVDATQVSMRIEDSVLKSRSENDEGDLLEEEEEEEESVTELYESEESDSEDEEEEEAEEYGEDRAAIEKEAFLLKTWATFYLHPERPVIRESVKTNDAVLARASNYFDRQAICEPLSLLEDESQEAIASTEKDLQDDLQALRTAARDYSHPEEPVVTADSTAGARCYFHRFSAADEGIGNVEEEEERVCILKDAQRLSTLAHAYHHPESRIRVDGASCGRNYFTRPSASLYEEYDDASETERALIQNDAARLAELATHYRMPQLPVGVKGMDPIAFGRNYFSRASAELNDESFFSEEQEEERSRILTDTASLAKLAAQYRMPQVSVSGQSLDPTACGRNYFTRASAETIDEAFSVDEEDERARILAEARAFGKVAGWYSHPEQPVANEAVGARCYFGRPSALGHEHMVHSFPAVAQHETPHHNHHLESGVLPHYNRNTHHHPHYDDDPHCDEHMDHFGLDEEIEARLEHLRHQLLPSSLKSKTRTGNVMANDSKADTKVNVNQDSDYDHDDEDEGKLSRSPSSVMLFTEESIYD